MDNNFNGQSSNGGNNGMFNSGSNLMGNSQNNMKGMIIGLVLALVSAVLGVVIYCVLGYSANMILFPMGAIILALEIFLYGKFAKEYNAIGLLVCVVFTLIAIFVGTRMATIYAYKGQIKDELHYEATYKQAKEFWELAKAADSATKMEYVKNMALGYIFSIGYAVLFLVNQRKKRR